MAGIGFRLQKLLSSQSYSDLLKAYVYSSVIATGPLLVIVLTLGILRWSIVSRLTSEESDLFQGVIVYIFAFSLIGTGPFLYIVTRYIADKFFLNQMEAFTPTYLLSLALLFFLQTGIGIPFLYFTQFDFQTSVILLSLYLSVNGIWMAMVFLSAADNYMWIVLAFVLGAILGISSAIYLGQSRGLEGYFLGMAYGQGLCFLILNVRLFIEFGYHKAYDFGFLTFFGKFPYLILVGIFFNLGIWIDKILFWFSSEGRRVIPHLYIAPNYDTPMFIAFLTVVPSMAFFLLQMETSFVKKFHAYYYGIRSRATLSQIRELKKAILEDLSQSFQKFALFQGIISGLAIIFIDDLAAVFDVNEYQLGILRIGILGAFLQMGFLLMLNIYFYFDFQKEAFWLCLVFYLTNALGTLCTQFIGLPAYGFGYAVSCFLTCVFGFTLLNYKLKDLNYYTFMMQPIVTPRYKFESESH